MQANSSSLNSSEKPVEKVSQSAGNPVLSTAVISLLQQVATLLLDPHQKALLLLEQAYDLEPGLPRIREMKGKALQVLETIATNEKGK